VAARDAHPVVYRGPPYCARASADRRPRSAGAVCNGLMRGAVLTCSPLETRVRPGRAVSRVATSAEWEKVGGDRPVVRQRGQESGRGSDPAADRCMSGGYGVLLKSVHLR